MKVKEDAKASPFTVNTEGLREKVRKKREREVIQGWKFSLLSSFNLISCIKMMKVNKSPSVSPRRLTSVSG